MTLSRAMHYLSCAACLFSLAAQADPRYTVTVVGGAGSTARGINSPGDVVG